MKFGPDWNGNGKTDAFDHYMNMKVIETSSKDSASGSASGNSTKTTGSNEKPEVTGISIFGKPMYDATKDSSGMTILAKQVQDMAPISAETWDFRISGIEKNRKIWWTMI